MGDNEGVWKSTQVPSHIQPCYLIKMYKVKVTTVAHYCPIVQDILLIWKTWDEWDNGKHKKIKSYCYHCDKLIN